MTIKKGGKVIILDPNPLNIFFYPYYFFFPRVDWAIEKNFLYSNRLNMKKILKNSNLVHIKIIPYGFFPGFISSHFPLLFTINNIILRIPLLNYFSSFNFFYGEKK